MICLAFVPPLAPFSSSSGRGLTKESASKRHGWSSRESGLQLKALLKCGLRRMDDYDELYVLGFVRDWTGVRVRHGTRPLARMLS